MILLISTVLYNSEIFNSESNNKNIFSENEAITDYSGIYYLHDDLPEHGQNIGNTHDVGDLLRAQPHGNEERYCAKWVQYDFDEYIFLEDSGHISLTITNIYYHIWWKSANKRADIGTEVHGYYDSHTEYSTSSSYDDAVSVSNKNGYWLTTHVQSVGYYEEDIHDMAVKVVSIDAIPSVFSGTNQYSFIILNLEDNETLKLQDKDDDRLTDYEELFTYFTNPDDDDTDNDGLSDLEEVISGEDGYITDPNAFDMDNDDIMDGEDPDPRTTYFHIINEEWIVTDSEKISNHNLLVNGNIIVKSGGRLTIEDSVLKMNQEGEQYGIRVEHGGELNIEDSVLITDDPSHWYSRTLNPEHWHAQRTFEIFGKAVLLNNSIDYGSIIYIRASNNTVIEGNTISHYYYGIFCSYSNPRINDNTILPFIGNGIFLWYSSPFITNTKIITYIGTGISCYFSSPIIDNSEISGGSNDFFLSGGSIPIVSNTKFNTSMVHIEDESSSLMIGTFDLDDQKGNENIKTEVQTKNDRLFMSIGIITFVVIFLIFLIFKKYADNGMKNQENSAQNREGKENKTIKIRPKNSWKSR
jgi:parallel beta-helix repeat protein